MKDYTLRNNKYILLSVIVIIFLWALLGGNYDDVIIPSISSTLKAMQSIILSGEFFEIIGASLKRFVEAFFITFFLSSSVALISRFNKFVYNFMIPATAILKSVPTMGIVIIALIWLDSSRAPVLIGFIVSFSICYEALIGAILSTDEEILDMAAIYDVKRRRIIKDIYIPCMIQGIISILPSVMGLILKAVIAGEVLGQPKYSIGGSMNLEKIYLNTPGVFAWIIIVMLLTFIFDIGAKIIKRRFLRWKD